MAVTFDPAKRASTLARRGLDFAEAEQIFAGTVFEFPDDRIDYGEVRMVTIGILRTRMVVIVWTDRPAGRHIISMRKANEREQQRYQSRLD